MSRPVTEPPAAVHRFVGNPAAPCGRPEDGLHSRQGRQEADGAGASPSRKSPNPLAMFGRHGDQAAGRQRIAEGLAKLDGDFARLVNEP